LRKFTLLSCHQQAVSSFLQLHKSVVDIAQTGI